MEQNAALLALMETGYEIYEHPLGSDGQEARCIISAKRLTYRDLFKNPKQFGLTKRDLREIKTYMEQVSEMDDELDQANI